MNLCKWPEDWLVLFNADKCKIMHFGYNDNMANYKLNDENLEVAKEERDLGVIMQNDLKCRLQCIKAVSTANKVLGMIRRSFVCKDR